jgi:hypothetical protein
MENAMTEQFDANEFLSEIGIEAEDGAQDTPAIKQLRKKIKELGKQHTAALTTIATYETEKTTAALSSVWKELAVPEVIQGFYTGEKTTEAIKAWWEASKTVFNVPPAVNADGTPATPAAPPAVATDLAAVQAASSLGADLNSVGLEAFQAKAKEVRTQSANRNPNALAELLSTVGIPAGGVTAPRA